MYAHDALSDRPAKIDAEDVFAAGFECDDASNMSTTKEPLPPWLYMR